ncbi:MAG: hypothetical protein AAF363_08005 [Bacteroidota bacterium]
MSKDKMRKVEMNLYVNLQGIIEFNANLGESGPWGSYTEPFDAVQFMTIDSGAPNLEPLDGIPTFPGNSKVSIRIQPSNMDQDDYSFMVEHVRLDLIGPREFVRSSPKRLWEDVLDLEKSQGAIGSEGNFFLGQTDDERRFDIITSPALTKLSYNVLYVVCFSIKLNGYIKYCIIDPLIRTSSGNR